MGIKETSRFNTKRNSEQLLTRPRPSWNSTEKNNGIRTVKTSRWCNRIEKINASQSRLKKFGSTHL
jgi:hypothetical protein